MSQMGHVTHKDSGLRTDGTNAPFFDGTQPCAQSDPESWFPEKHTNTHEVKAVMRVCQACEFKEPCLEYALKEDLWGIWGGTTERQRARIRRTYR